MCLLLHCQPIIVETVRRAGGAHPGGIVVRGQRRGSRSIARRLAARLAFGTVLTLWLAAPLSAQETREEEIARLQAEKAAQLRTPEPTRAERVTRRILGPPGPIYAWAGSIYPGGMLAVGAGAGPPVGDTARVTARAGISILDYRLFEAGFRFPDPVRDRISLSTYVRRIDAPRVRFHEPGGTLRNARDTRFAYTPTTIGLAGDVHLSRDITAGLAVERLDADVDWRNPSDPIVRLAPGDDTTYGILRASLRADTRDAEGYSTRGGLYRVEWSAFGDRATGGPASFRKTELEAVQLIPIARAHWIVALRGLVTMTDTGAGKTVPFFMLPSLGGGSTLRGYHSWRFRDRHRVLLSGEYRWTAGQLVEMALFADAGKVVADRSDLDLSGLRKDYGIGIRFHGPETTPLRVDLARGDEGWRLSIGGGAAF